MPFPQDKLDDVVAEAMKPLFSAYVANVAGGMPVAEAMKKLERGLAILREGEQEFRKRVEEMWK